MKRRSRLLGAKSLIFTSVLGVPLLGCAKAPQSAEVVPAPSAAASVTTVTAGPEPQCRTTFRSPVGASREVVVSVEITNQGAAPVELNELAISSPSLALELMGADGKRFHDGPPPMPPEKMPMTKLAPGETLTRRFELPNLSLAPGKYKLAFVCPNHAEPAWQELVVLGN